MEPLKNTLGNLTILDPGQNNIGGNEDFGTKKLIYEGSSILLTREKIAQQTSWTAQAIATHQQFLIDMALNVFQP